MRYEIKTLSCNPAKLKDLSEKLIVSHYENNYGGAVKRLNAITAQLESLDFATAPVFVINGLCYVAYSIASRHLSRDLAPTSTDLRSIGQSVADHLRFKHPTGEAAKRYNVLQKLTYLAVIFVLLPLVILMGMAMSPWLDSLWPGWIDVFGGRQSARTIHFIAAWLLVLFVLIHVFEVIISGFWNHMRSMITGRFSVEQRMAHDAKK